MQEYPKWLPVSGPGHPQNPGHVLVENEDQEAEALASGQGPADLNPPPDPGQKSLDEMSRDELIAILVKEGIPDDMSDDEIRNAIRHGREAKADAARQEQEDAEHDREAREAGGDHGDGLQTTTAPKASKPAPKDAKGDAIPADVADEANKGGDTDTRTAPAAKSAQETDARPDDAKAKEADDAPAGNVTEVAATPKDSKKGTGAKS